MRSLRILALVAAAALLAGCISVSEPVPVTHYPLMVGQTAYQHGRHPTTQAASKPIIFISEIDAPAWLNTRKLYYQLSYRPGAPINAYSRSNWIAPVPMMLRKRIKRTLNSSGHWQAVVGPHTAGPAKLRVSITLNDFEQRFKARHQSAGILDATVTLIDTQDHQIVAQQHFRLVHEAPSGNAHGGVTALRTASRTFARKLGQWLIDVTDADESQ